MYDLRREEDGEVQERNGNKYIEDIARDREMELKAFISLFTTIISTNLLHGFMKLGGSMSHSQGLSNNP